MYVERVRNRNSPPAVLLRESYRLNGEVKKRTLANLSKCPPHAVDALRAALKGEVLAPNTALPLSDQFEISASPAHGHVAAVLGTMKHLGIPRLIDRADCEERKIALALIAARVLFPQSKLATLRTLAPEAILNSTDENAPRARKALNLVPPSTLAEELALDMDSLTLSDVYGAMRWLFSRQRRIERSLAKTHLYEGSLALYDLTSTYYEGTTCPLAQFGHNRDKKRGKRQINFGLLCDQDGRPVSCEAYAGNVADPMTVTSQIHKLRRQFGLNKVVLVGDRGMLTQARIDEELKHLEGLAWISALNHKSVKALVEEGVVQPELFDDFGVAEIQSPSYPDERLVVCYNPALATKRTEKRLEMLAITDAKLETIREATRRARNPYRGKVRIARRMQREAGKYKMLKHYDIKIEEDEFEFSRNQQSIDKEAGLDGFYIIRSGGITKEEMSGESLVDAYKKLSEVERAFRTFKSIDIKVRPIHHREEEMVRAHIFLCMLAYYVEWHMRESLAPMLFVDEEKEKARADRVSAVEPVKRSASGERKAEVKTDEEGRPLHSFQTLLMNLSAIARNRVEPGIEGIPAFTKVTRPDAQQARALELLGVEV